MFLVKQAYAQAKDCEFVGEGIDLGTCLKLSNSQNVKDVYSSPAVLANLIVQNLFIVGGIILFVILFVAGFKAVAGGKKGFDEGVQMAKQAAIGFTVLFCAYWFVAILQTITGVNFGL